MTSDLIRYDPPRLGVCRSMVKKLPTRVHAFILQLERKRYSGEFGTLMTAACGERVWEENVLLFQPGDKTTDLIACIPCSKCHVQPAEFKVFADWLAKME